MTRKSKVFMLVTICLVIAWLATISYLTIVRPFKAHTLFFSQDSQGYIYPLDFLHFYQVGKLAAGSMHEHVYDRDVQRDLLNKLIAPDSIKNFLYTPYTPFAFVLMRPFAALSLEHAYLVWLALSLVTACGAIWLVLRKCLYLSRLDSAFYLVWLLAWMPAFSSMRTGQLTWLVLTLLSVFVWSWLKGKDVFAGLCLALMTIKPQYAVFFIVAVLAQRQWKLLAYAALFELILIVLAGFTIGLNNVINYPLFLYQAEHSSKVIGFGLEPFVNLRRLLAGFLPLNVALWLSLLGTVLALAWTYRLWSEPNLLKIKNRFCWALSLTVVIAVFFSPHTIYYDCFLLAVAACLTMPAPDRILQMGKAEMGLKVWIAVFVLYPLFSWIVCLSMPNKSLQTLPFLLVNLALLVAGSIYYYGDSAKQSEH